MSSKLMNKLKIGHSKSTNIIVDRASKVSKLASPILKTSLSHHHHHPTTKSSEKSVFTLDEQSSGLSSPSLPFNQQLVDVETVADAAELPPEKISEIVDEMVREESERKNT
ncbi:hypothetical protein WUBG_17436, partial [Wuchereria bancrofti]